MRTCRLGCSGWSYKHWMEAFYPKGLPSGQLLKYYSQRFNTVEINMTFYRYPTEKTVARWRSETDEGFLFSVKMNRLITHRLKLKRTESAVDSFISVVEGLREKLGPILIQLPPQLRCDLDILGSFLPSLPTRHRYAIEFRHSSWYNEKTWKLLERNGVAICLLDSEKFFLNDVITSSFSYIRWHGRNGKRHGDYSREDIEEWAETISELDVSEVFGYFNNDVEAHAPKNCQMLMEMLPSCRLSKTDNIEVQA